MKRTFFLGRLLLLVSFVGAGPVLAASEGGHGYHAPSIADLVWPAANFLLYCGLLWKLAWPAVRDGLAERRRVVEREIEAADRAETNARALFEEIRALRAGEEAEATRIRAEVRQEGERERDRLVEGARAAAGRIRENSRRLGEYEAMRSARAIREAVAGEAARRAADSLRTGIGEADEQRFLVDFLGGVSARGGR